MKKQMILFIAAVCAATLAMGTASGWTAAAEDGPTQEEPWVTGYILPNGTEVMLEPVTEPKPDGGIVVAHRTNLNETFPELGITFEEYFVDVGADRITTESALYFAGVSKLLVDPLPDIVYAPYTGGAGWQARETTQQERDNMAYLMRYVWREKGDVNIDGKVSSLDALRVLEQVAGVQAEQPLFDLDVNGDGKVSGLDALYILEQVAGMR